MKYRTLLNLFAIKASNKKTATIAPNHIRPTFVPMKAHRLHENSSQRLFAVCILVMTLCGGVAFAQNEPKLAVSAFVGDTNANQVQLGLLSQGDSLQTGKPVSDTMQPIALTIILTTPPAQPQVPADALPATHSKPMNAPRKVAMALWGCSLLSAGGGFYYDSKSTSYEKDYENATMTFELPGAQIAYDDMQTANQNRNIGYGFAIGTLVAGAALWLVFGD
jgi:hypothetical protein